VRHRPHRVEVTLVHQAPAYLDEEYPIAIDITNMDDRPLEVVVDVLLQPTEIDHAGGCLVFHSWYGSLIDVSGAEWVVNSIMLGEEQSAGLVRGVSFGVIGPGVNVVRTLYLRSMGAPGDRMVDISVRTLCIAGTNTGTEAGAAVVVEQERGDVSETLRTLVVPTVEAVKVGYGVVYRRKVGKGMGPGDLRAFEPEYWDDREGGEGVVNVRFECGGPWRVVVESVKLVRKVRVGCACGVVIC
jgi:hypothetical protein